MKKLSIIIVNWNVKDLLEKCLNSIYKMPQKIDFEVFVVDNASKDGSAEMIKEKFPQVKLTANKENKGFAVANNQGIKESKGEFILLLNPDTEIIDNALEKMVDFMAERQDAGILGCQLLNPDYSLQLSCRAFPSLFSQIVILLKLHNFFPKLVKKYYLLEWPHHEIKEVDQVMGACFLIRRKLIDEIGLLDEGYWALFEEVDYCKRAKDKGWKVYFTPEAKVIHHKGQSFGQQKIIAKQINFNRNLLKYFKKYHHKMSYLILYSLQPISIFLTYLLKIYLKLKLPFKKKKYL
ncbi:MAG: family 2 glycosyl transferase [Parcubacteria group bacterium Athens1014_10]|nr:MAG: family 2 glycosyl transferase [Parcubacteria group bacterium Athens1014_10]TSD04727.1 MAG: family 2 glycosyl transferase [Parcubacteria group bacterium Athens0714_12]